ncbi:MAG: sugar ABC transporter permease [Planctomycetota bacterium]
MNERGLVGHGIVPYLYLTPAILVLGVFFFGSFLWVIMYSLGTLNVFEQSFTFTGFDNYVQLFNDERFWMCLGNSFLYLLVTPALIAISLACALAIDAQIRGANTFRLLFFLPVVTPTIVAAIGWRILFNEQSGLLTTLAQPVVSVGDAARIMHAAFVSEEWGLLGGNAHPAVAGVMATLHVEPLSTPRWLTERPWTLISPMVVTLWKGFGFYMMIFLAGLLAVPRELREAAALDGAGRWTSFLHVTLPSIWPTMTLVTILSSISALKVFDEIFVTVRGVPVDHQTAVPFVYDAAFNQGSFGTACAAGVVLFVILLVFSIINLRLTRDRS